MKKIVITKNNKGIAMITVMIAVAFISIIASAMLYTSTTNYVMKTANLRTKQNFYQTDGELVKVSSAIRNASMSAAKPLDFADSLKRTTGDTSKYDCGKIAALVYPSGVHGSGANAYVLDSEGDKIYFKTGNGTILKQTKTDDASIIDGVTRYTYKDFEVVQTNASGYQNSVKSDLIIDIYETSVPSGGAGGVGNMSLLLDANIVFDDDQFTSLTMTGNSFMISYGGAPVAWGSEGSFTPPGNAGIKMSSESRLNFYGEYNVVYGDIDLSGKASLVVYGNLTVYGDIKLSGNATLIMAGNGQIHMIGEPLPGRGTAVSDLYINGSNTASEAHNCYPSDLRSKIDKTLTKDDFKTFCSTINLNDGDATNDGLLKKILKKVSVDGSTQYITDATGNINGLSSASGKFNSATNDFRSLSLKDTYKYNGKNIGFGIIEGGYNANLNGAHEYLLCINNSVNTVKMTQPNTYTTFLGKKPLHFNVQHGVVLTKLGTSEFNYITAAKGDAEGAMYNNTDNPFNDITIQFVSGTWHGAIGDFFEADCNAYVDEMFNASTGGSSSGSKKYASAIYFKNYVRDDVE